MKQLFGQAMAFGSVGIVNTAIGFAVIALLMLLGIDPLISNALGFATGLVISFVLNRNWTFRADRGTGTRRPAVQGAKFAVAFAIAWLCNFSVLWAGLRSLATSPFVLQLAGMATYTVIFFVLCRVWVFRTRR